MHPSYSLQTCIIKPQGLSLGGKYSVTDAQNNLVFFVEY